MTSKSKTNGKEVKGEYLLREPYARTLRKWRILRRLNQAQLAKAAKLPARVGGSLERCERPIDLKEIVKLCHALSVHPRRFLDEVHSLIQHAIQPLDAEMRTAKGEEGAEEPSSGDQEIRKATALLAEKVAQLLIFIDEVSNRGWSSPDDEPQGGQGGRTRFKPSRR